MPIFYLNYPEFISVAKKQSKVIKLIFLNKSFSIIGTILDCWICNASKKNFNARILCLIIYCNFKRFLP